MPLWKYFINTKPEVDDSDLPLPQYRVYDDDGNVKPDESTTTPRVSVNIVREKTGPKKSTPMSPKTRAKILRSVGATPTAPRKPNATRNAAIDTTAKTSASAESPAPLTPPRAPSSSSRLSPASSRNGSQKANVSASAKSSPTRAASPKQKQSTLRSPPPKSVTPARSRRSASKQSVTPRRSSTSPSRSSTPASSSASPARPPKRQSVTRSVSPGGRGLSRSPTGRKLATSSTATPDKKASMTPRKSRSKRGRSSSSSRERKPSSRWTISALKAYANENGINITQEKTKAEILSKIEAHKSR